MQPFHCLADVGGVEGRLKRGNKGVLCGTKAGVAKQLAFFSFSGFHLSFWHIHTVARFNVRANNAAQEHCSKWL